MEIYAVRHAKPAVEAGTCYGQTDIETEKLISDSIDKLLNDLPIENALIYSSDLVRCKHLCAQLSIDSKAIYDSRLRELNFGDWEMKLWDKIPLDELNPWMENFVTASPPNGESFENLYKRVELFYNEVNIINKPIIIVTHAGVIRALNSIVNHLPLKDAFDLKIDFLEIIKFEKP